MLEALFELCKQLLLLAVVVVVYCVGAILCFTSVFYFLCLCRLGTWVTHLKFAGIGLVGAVILIPTMIYMATDVRDMLDDLF